MMIEDVRMLSDCYSQAQWDRLSRQERGSTMPTLSATTSLAGPKSYSFCGVDLSAEVYEQVMGWMQSGLDWEDYQLSQQEMQEYSTRMDAPIA